jgi:hypothetical protein
MPVESEIWKRCRLRLAPRLSTYFPPPSCAAPLNLLSPSPPFRDRPTPVESENRKSLRLRFAPRPLVGANSAARCWLEFGTTAPRRTASEASHPPVFLPASDDVRCTGRGPPSVSAGVSVGTSFVSRDTPARVGVVPLGRYRGGAQYQLVLTVVAHNFSFHCFCWHRTGGAALALRCARVSFLGGAIRAPEPLPPHR